MLPSSAGPCDPASLSPCLELQVYREVKLIQQHSQLPPLRLPVNMCDWEEQVEAVSMQSAGGCPCCQSGDHHAPAGLQLSRYLSPRVVAPDRWPCAGAVSSAASVVLLRKLIDEGSACVYQQ